MKNGVISTKARRFGLVSSILMFALLLISHNLTANEQCIPEGKWLLPGSGKTVKTASFLPQMYKEDVILMGEHHANQSHHEWQLDILQRLQQNNPNLAIGLEMFPRRMQPLLDKWVSKKVNEQEFIDASEWDDIWAYDFNHYSPLLKFARENNIPLIAINVDKSLLKMVGKHGWENIPQQHRGGISDPAKPTRPYVRQLAVSFQGHYEDPSQVSRQAFARFVQQQLLWDRAMAEALATTRAKYPTKQLIGIVGSWHIINGHGIPHQLNSLGIDKTLTLVPWDKHLSCDSVNQQFADAIFGSVTTKAVSLSNDN